MTCKGCGWQCDASIDRLEVDSSGIGFTTCGECRMKISSGKYYNAYLEEVIMFLTIFGRSYHVFDHIWKKLSCFDHIWKCF